MQEIERRRAEIETEAYGARGRELNEELGQAAEAERLARDARSAAEHVAGQFEERRPHIRSLGELVEHGKRVGLEDSRCPLCGSEITEESFESHLHATEERVEHESGGLSAALTRREEALRAEGAAESRRRQAEGTVREHRRVGDELRGEFEEVIREIREMEGFAIPEDDKRGGHQSCSWGSQVFPRAGRGIAGRIRGVRCIRTSSRAGEGSDTGPRTPCFGSKLSGGGSACKLTSGSSQSDSETSGRRTR